MSPTLPLTGTRILASEQYGAGPYGTMFLAQLGAEVIKLEPPKGGDSARATGPYFLGADDSLFYQTFNLNKRSLTLDIRTQSGKAVLHRLVAKADAVTNNARGDLPAKLGLDYAALGRVNPAIVCVHASAYGREGPRASWPGYDYLMQAEAGFMSVTGAPTDPPTRFGLSMVDFITGTMLATATLAGLKEAAATDKGRDFDISLLDAALHQTSYPAYWYLNEGFVTGRAERSAHPSVTPSQTFRTADGWVFVMAQLAKFWVLLTDALGVPHLQGDARFATMPARLENRDALTTILDGIFLQHPTAHWVAKLGGIVPVAAVNDLAQALDGAGDMVDTVAHAARPEGLRVLSNPIRIDGARLPNRASPALGADTQAILDEAGFTSAEIAALRADGTV
ncbi:CaiB/BaiF CoA transferase family protein [Glacieibacterium frigidum]|uniref:CoA transferase n=1 Tax=Glacieibacterium frigidum TaxID=2593303 RepID=A0A552UII8_9SPHN|nr:CoA transferase [Glacieibacterium frigidum]TRW18033.1 CoA transferase [Glacieibacterium frigidum]